MIFLSHFKGVINIIIIIINIVNIDNFRLVSGARIFNVYIIKLIIYTYILFYSFNFFLIIRR